MSWTILKSSLQLKRVSLFWYSLGIAIYGWWVVSFYPSIQASVDYTKIIEEMLSPELLAAFGGSGMDLSTFGGFAGVEYLSLMWVLIAAAAVVMFAASALGGAIDNGSMETTLAQPVSRTQVVVSRWLAMVVYSGILSLVTSATLYLPGRIYDVEVELNAAVSLFLVGWLLMLAMGGFAYLVSAMVSSAGRVNAVSFGVIFIMWIADAFGNLSKDWSWARDFSLFKYWTPGKILQGEAVQSETWLVFGIAAVLFFLLSVIVFRRRDVV